MREPDAYEWIDPWEMIDDAMRIQTAWYDREEYFRADMRMAVASSHEHMYQVRRQNEVLLQRLSDITAFQNFQPTLVRS